MAYNQFTLRKVVHAFDLKIIEGERLFPEVKTIEPSPLLQELLVENLPWAEAVSSEKARSEAIINPILLEVSEFLQFMAALAAAPPGNS